jgi:hypothetical protein
LSKDLKSLADFRRRSTITGTIPPAKNSVLRPATKDFAKYHCQKIGLA